MMREIHIRYRINEDNPVQLFTARVFERFLEEGLLKLFAKAFTKKVVEELEAKSAIDGLVEPMMFFEEDGEIVRASIPDEEDSESDAEPGAETEKALEKMYSVTNDPNSVVVSAEGTNKLIAALEGK